MGFATFLDNTALTIDPRLLDECYRIWRMREFKGLPPDPYDVVNLSLCSYEVLTWAEIVRFYEDEDKRKALGAE